MKPLIIRKLVPNKKSVYLAVNTALSDDHIELFFLPLSERSGYYLEKLGVTGAQLIKDVNNIPGCTEVTIGRYDIFVKIGDAFDADEDGITEELITVVKKAFGDKAAEVHVRTE